MPDGGRGPAPDAEVVHEGELHQRRVKRFTLLARTVPNLIHTLLPGSLLMTPCDRSDVVLLTAMAAMNFSSYSASSTAMVAIACSSRIVCPPEVRRRTTTCVVPRRSKCSTCHCDPGDTFCSRGLTSTRSSQ